MSAYFYFQKVGGEEAWHAIPAEQTAELAKLSPTFVTILSLDTLVPDQPSREQLEKIRYQGPMYWDLDAAEIEDSIEGGKALLLRLAELGVEDSDLSVFLSGKKGLHILLDQACFMQKPLPMVKLPAIYKEWAFKLAVNTVDFKVYTARKGRMLRTCFNIRENGNYRVPVTPQELRDLTPERYQELCKTPRTVAKATPQYRWKASIEFDACVNKVPKTTPKRSAPTDAVTIARHWVNVADLFNGTNVVPDVGFNKIAMQMALYSREAGWNAETLAEKAQGLIQNHASDGSRYNTPRKREAELRRMLDYVDDNPAYEYSLGGLKSMMVQVAAPMSEDEDGMPITVLSSGVLHRGNCYAVPKGEEGEMQISNFVFTEIVTVSDLADGMIVSITANLKGLSNKTVVLSPTNFTSSSGLQNAIAAYGASFTGSDVQARGVFQLMLKEISFNRFLISTEGLSVINVSAAVSPELKGIDIIVWADRAGVQMPDFTKDSKFDLTFQGYPDPAGLLRTDLTQTPALSTYMESGGQQDTKVCLQSLFACHPPETVGKILGWMVACHWKSLFQKNYSKFPLLHVYGAAGAGKSELTMSLLHLFYYKEEPKSLTPSGTPFSFSTMISASASIPIVLDEYKPHTMSKEKLEAYRAILRDAYNAKTVSRGGGSRTKDNFNALNTMALSGPVGFIAEAVETETALMERSLLVAIKRQSPRAAAEGLQHFLRYVNDLTPLSVLGKQLAGWIVSEWTVDSLKLEFDAMHQWALAKYMVQPDDQAKLDSGELSKAAYERKLLGRPRPIYNSTVALFGIVQLRKLLQMLFPGTFEADFAPQLKAMANAVYENMDVVARTSMPEYIKVLQTLTDMAKMRSDAPYALVENVDYNLYQAVDKRILAFHPRSAYNKYRAYMRIIGANPLYPTDSSFEIALTETSQFIGYGEGTKQQAGKTILLDLGELVRAGMPDMPGKLTSPT